MLRLATFLLMAVSLPATADVPGLEGRVRSCAAIQRASERLGCYDRAAAELRAAEVRSNDAAAARESSFGLLLSSQTASQPTPADAELDSIVSTVQRKWRNKDQAQFVSLANGQVWRIKGRDPLVRMGDIVTIRRGALGSFQMVVPSGRSAKVRRIT